MRFSVCLTQTEVISYQPLNVETVTADVKVQQLNNDLPYVEYCKCICNIVIDVSMYILQDEFKPVKYFSIDRVFRNETLDNTHLAEFHQIEGVVADVGLTLGDLMGVINEFFRKLGTHFPPS